MNAISSFAKKNSNRLFLLFIVVMGLTLVVALVLTFTARQPATAPVASNTLPEADPVVLRLAVSDVAGAPSESSVLEFVEQVRSRSDGKIVIEPVWDAGANTAAGFEQGVIAAVKNGQYDLGLAGSRAFEEQGVKNFVALQTPFLINNDALAISVAKGDVATRMLDGLSASGLAGLTIWPEDLRHPFSTLADKPLLSPADYSGATIRTTSMGVTAALFEALGGEPEFEAFDYRGTEAGFRQGYTLSGRPIATGNVVFFPKFQVLFANEAAFSQLSEANQAILQEAAAATQEKTIAQRPSDMEAASAWCADGGGVVLASNEQLAALEAAVQPVVEKITADPMTADFVAAIRELKAGAASPPAVEACEPAPVQTAADSSNQTWSDGPPPVGVWTVDLTLEDVIAMGVLESNAPGWAGLSQYEFRDGEGNFHGEFLDDASFDCPFTIKVAEDYFSLTYTTEPPNDMCAGQVDDLQWRLDEEGLHLHVVAIHGGLLVENTALYEAKPWQLKVEEWAEGLPPNGIWQVELSVDDFVRFGALRSNAENDWAGTYTFTLEDGEFSFAWQSLSGFTAGCTATYEEVDNAVRFTYYTDTNECEGEVDDVQWRLDESGGLLFHMVGSVNAPAEVRGIWEAKPWEKIGEN